MFRDGNQGDVVYRQGIRSGRECERLEFHSRQVIAREIPPVLQCRSVSQQYGGVRPDALTSNWASKNFKTVFESKLFFIR